MKDYCIFNPSGLIYKYGSTTEYAYTYSIIPESGMNLVGEKFLGFEYYWNGVAQVLRPEQTITQDTDTITADGVAVSTFTGIAENSEAFIDKVLQGTVDATGTVSISFDTVGTYQIKFVLFPNLDAGYQVNAN